MDNVIPLRPAPPVPIRREPEPRAQTIRELSEQGITIKPGDFVFVVRSAVLSGSTPGSGRVREVWPDAAPGVIQLRFDFNTTFTLGPEAEIVWYPDPSKEN